MKKVYIPDHRNISGANIWIYEGYRKAWESLGYTTEYYNPDSKKILEISNDFKNLTLIQRHQLIYKILKDMIKTEIHALSMKLLDIEEYNKN